MASGNRFTTAGLTAGIDFRTSNRLIVGVGSGMTPTAATSDRTAHVQTPSSYSAALYGNRRLFSQPSGTLGMATGTLGLRVRGLSGLSQKSNTG